MKAEIFKDQIMPHDEVEVEVFSEGNTRLYVRFPQLEFVSQIFLTKEDARKLAFKIINETGGDEAQSDLLSLNSNLLTMAENVRLMREENVRLKCEIEKIRQYAIEWKYPAIARLIDDFLNTPQP